MTEGVGAITTGAGVVDVVDVEDEELPPTIHASKFLSKNSTCTLIRSDKEISSLSILAIYSPFAISIPRLRVLQIFLIFHGNYSSIFLCIFLDYSLTAISRAMIDDDKFKISKKLPQYAFDS